MNPSDQIRLAIERKKEMEIIKWILHFRFESHYDIEQMLCTCLSFCLSIAIFDCHPFRNRLQTIFHLSFQWYYDGVFFKVDSPFFRDILWKLITLFSLELFYIVRSAPIFWQAFDMGIYICIYHHYYMMGWMGIVFSCRIPLNKTSK